MKNYISKIINKSPKVFLRNFLGLSIFFTAALGVMLPENLIYANTGNVGSLNKTNTAKVQAQSSTHSMTLKQLGSLDGIYLYGQDGRNNIFFKVRSDEVVTTASIKLLYKYSPDLLSEHSQFNIYLNGESIATLETPKENGNKDLETTINIPPELIAESNKFTFQLICRSTTSCEDPRNPKLWAYIGSQTTLTFSSLPLILQNDLSILPIPFIDLRDSQKQGLPFIFLNKPSNTTLEAAGIISSWLGSSSEQSNLLLPVSIGSIPNSGSAIILIDSPASVPGIALPSITGPMIFITSNPRDPYGKFLFVMGNDATELKQASTALALGIQDLSGQSYSVTSLPKAGIRKPYDAPNWLSSNGPIKLSEINQSRLASGIDPDQANTVFRIQMPPALYSPDKKGVPIQLNYSYQNIYKNNVSLDIYYKSQFIQSLTLPMPGEWLSFLSSQFNSLINTIGIDAYVDLKIPNESIVRNSNIYIPLELVNDDRRNLLPNLQVVYSDSFDFTKDCVTAPIANQSNWSISPDSTINISQLSHFIGMPNLAAFSNSGFPYSRLADLSETAVVLPDKTSIYDLSAYLSLVGRIGKLTGYPGVSLSVVNLSEIDAVKTKDILAISSGNDNQVNLKPWEKIITTNTKSIFSLKNGFESISSWFVRNPITDLYQSSFITGFESPFVRDRSIIVIASVDPENLVDIVGSLDGSLGPIFGSFIEFSDGKISKIIDSQTYHNGSLSFLNYLFWCVAEYPALFLLISIIGIVMLSLLIYAGLKSKRKQRLQ
jgi:hypothetical protein